MPPEVSPNWMQTMRSEHKRQRKTPLGALICVGYARNAHHAQMSYRDRGTVFPRGSGRSRGSIELQNASRSMCMMVRIGNSVPSYRRGQRGCWGAESTSVVRYVVG